MRRRVFVRAGDAAAREEAGCDTRSGGTNYRKCFARDLTGGGTGAARRPWLTLRERYLLSSGMTVTLLASIVTCFVISPYFADTIRTV